MVKTPGIGFWVDVFLVKEMQQQNSLIFFVNIFKPSIWRTPHCYLAFSGTKRKPLVLCSHVDDLILGGEREAVEWFVSELKGKFTLQGGEIVPAKDQDPGEPIRFLKKRHLFTEAGVIVSPHKRYTEELVTLYGWQHRKPRGTPDVSSEDFASKELDEKSKHRFRSAMARIGWISNTQFAI